MGKSAAVLSSSLLSKTVLDLIVCLSPLMQSAAHRHAMFSTTVPFVPHVALKKKKKKKEHDQKEEKREERLVWVWGVRACVRGRGGGEYSVHSRWAVDAVEAERFNDKIICPIPIH